jgi:hypothetical protein
MLPENPQEDRADEVRAYLVELGITEDDVRDAIAWARANPSKPKNPGKPE